MIPEHTAFLEYAVLDEKTFVFIVTRKGLQVENRRCLSKKAYRGLCWLFASRSNEKSQAGRKNLIGYIPKLIQPAEKTSSRHRELGALSLMEPYIIFPLGALLTDDTENTRLLLEQYESVLCSFLDCLEIRF